MLKKAEERKIFNGSLKIRVLRPEDIIGLKLQAVKNDSSRRNKDIEDIKFLLSNYKNDIDSALIKKYFELLEMMDLYKDLIEDNNELI